ncbi:MAG: PIN domain-containing protein [Methylocystis sp.]
MILVDTSIWIDHFRRPNVRLATLLNNGEVLTHGFIIGELALGNMANRKVVLSLLCDLAMAPTAQEGDVLELIERRSLHGAGIGYVDAHLIAAALLAASLLWTRDRRLQSVAARIGISLQ